MKKFYTALALIFFVILAAFIFTLSTEKVESYEVSENKPGFVSFEIISSNDVEEVLDKFIELTQFTSEDYQLEKYAELIGYAAGPAKEKLSVDLKYLTEYVRLKKKFRLLCNFLEELSKDNDCLRIAKEKIYIKHLLTQEPIIKVDNSNAYVYVLLQEGQYTDDEYDIETSKLKLIFKNIGGEWKLYDIELFRDGKISDINMIQYRAEWAQFLMDLNWKYDSYYLLNLN